MNSEDFVTYEQAVKLKELGFDEPCYNFWSLEPDGKPIIITSTLGNVRNSDLKGRDIIAPFLWQAYKWLRKNKKVDINITLEDETDDPYQVEIYINKECVSPRWKHGFFTEPESALSAGITECIKLLEK